ncbi:HAMP domain-containing histidine kinase [Ancylothrix sp. C2]|uniref:sensor histidine kinase n=1 Tax=Ancylothrix sp. D3o TaxID=2953691 RepID=UPI0021BB6AF6|nr:HAMP domain-containing histidine kinase [Ancylothrix sp. D3o]MCT7950390.1 HAMP domain-containing histidine kinase [Ancylothrix sp. D3o]
MQRQERIFGFKSLSFLSAGKRGESSAKKWGFKFWLKSILSRLSIREKIGYGYALALSIAVLGTLTGRLVEGYSKHLAMTQLGKSQEATALLNDLQRAMIQAQTYHQKIISLPPDSPNLRVYYFNFFDANLKTENLLYKTQKFCEKDYNLLDNSHHQRNAKELTALLVNYKDVVANYQEEVYKVFKDSEPESLNKEDLITARQFLIEFSKSQESLKFTAVSEKFSSLVQSFEAETQEELQDYREAEWLGTLILIGSLFASTATAALMAVYTSHAIARPLETATKLAQQVSEEANFQLRVPVSSDDEVGVLASSLNQLIEWVAIYTQELKQAQAQLIQAEKMSSLGQMVAGLAHEINNPVSFIYGNLEYAENYAEDLLRLVNLYQKYYPQPGPEIEGELEATDLDFIREDLPKIIYSMKNGAERIRQLILSLRNFSRLDESDFKAVDLHEGIESTLLILNNRLMAKNVEVKKLYQDLPLVECYPALLNQVFMNILVNAIDAMEEQVAKKVITISTELEKKEAENEVVKVRIADRGVGISAEIKEKIFDPFFTTKPVGSGTGLGLSICYQIVEKHGGQISVFSQVGVGTEFEIVLPVKPLQLGLIPQ